MLSVGIVATGGVGYYLRTVGSGVDDYYARTEPGRWVGAGTARLGLSGLVLPDQVDALAAGVHPVSGEPLGLRAGKVTAFDLTFSSPKSVSVLAELADPDTRATVAAAHRDAVAAALGFATEAGVLVGRRGAGGARQIPTAGPVAAEFVHRSSRAGDPQLHSHLLLFNRAEGIDGRWGGLHGRRIFAWAKTTGYVYQAALRAELTTRLGVCWQPARNGVAEIDGVDPAVLAGFSTRRAQIEAALAEVGAHSARAAQVATLATRPATPEPVEPGRQRQQWWAQATQLGLDQAQLAGCLDRSYTAGIPEQVAAGWADRLVGPAGLTEHRSSFDRRAVVQAVAESATAGWWPDRIVATADGLLTDGRVVGLGVEHPLAGPLYSTVDLLELEADLLDRYHRHTGDGLAVCAPGSVDVAIGARPSLSGEQEAMIRHLCGSGSGIRVVIGRAGTGKTFALDACRDAWTTAGIPVAGAALAARTAAGLQAGTGVPSTTIDQLLNDLARPGPIPVLPVRGVLVVDEASLVGTRKLASLAVAAERHRCALVLVGDPRQLPEVDAGGAFAALASEGAVELTANRRQEHEWERDALAQLRHGDVTNAVAIYRDRQRISLAPSAESARAALVADWATAYHQHGDQAVMLALHQVDVDQLNGLARARLQANGQLGGRHLDAAGRSFAVGDEVLALRNDRRLGVTNGTRGRVTGLHPLERSLVIETSYGTTVELPWAYLHDGHLTHGYALTIHKAQGLTVAHAFLLGSDRLYREAGYVGLSRATQRNDLYQLAPPPPGWQPATDAHHQLATALSRSAAQTLATEQTGRHRNIDGAELATLRDAALADPGSHLVDRLGPPPLAGPRRDAWAAAATAIEHYRHTYRHHDPADPLGPRPIEREQRRRWEHAHAAAHQVDRHRELGRDLGHGLEL